MLAIGIAIFLVPVINLYIAPDFSSVSLCLEIN